MVKHNSEDFPPTPVGVFWENRFDRKAWYFRDYTGNPCKERYNTREAAQAAFEAENGKAQ